MSLDAFWRTTPTETALVLDAYRERCENDQRLAAWHACNIMNMWAPKGKKIRLEQLLGKDNKVVFLDADSLRAHMRQRIAASAAEEGKKG